MTWLAFSAIVIAFLISAAFLLGFAAYEITELLRRHRNRRHNGSLTEREAAQLLRVRSDIQAVTQRPPINHDHKDAA